MLLDIKQIKELQTSLDDLDTKIDDKVKIETFVLTGTNITNKYVSLSSVPSPASSTLLWIGEGAQQVYTDDYVINGTFTQRLEWVGLTLDGELTAGDTMVVQYLT